MKMFRTRHFAAGLLVAWILALAAGFASAPAAAQSVGWQARWDGGLVDSLAQGWDVAEGANGNIYAVGEVYKGVGRDLMTLAWNPAGDLLWYRIKDGIEDSDDAPAQLAVAGDGRVIVIGTATRSSSSSIAIVAYDSAGNELWSHTYSNPTYRWNRAKGIAVAANGQTIVFGEVSNGSTNWSSLVAYDSAGGLAWERVYALAPDDGSLALGPTGIVAVAGASHGSPTDFMTVAFDLAGNELWARIRDGGANRDDSIHSIVADANGRFVVTGSSATDSAGRDILTVAYDALGNEVWAATRGGPGDQDSGWIAADASGSVYVAGAPASGFPNSALLLVSYDSSGMERWAMTVPDGAGESSQATGMTVSADGNVAMTGRRHGPLANDPQAFAVKVSSTTGTVVWTKIRTPAPGRSDSFVGIAPGATGSCFVIGWSIIEYAEADLLSIAYDSNGNELWVRKEPQIHATDVPGSTPDSRGRQAITTGYDGRVYLTGTSFDGKTRDYMTVAYDAFGHKLWQARKSNPNDAQAFPAAITVDPENGNVYVAGTTAGQGGTDYLTVAYDRTGAELWSRTRQGSRNGSDNACCIALAANGLIIVTGNVSDGQGFGAPDLLTVAYAPGGNEIWSDEWGPTPSSAELAFALTVGTTGIVYVGGATNDSSPEDTLTVAYDALGNRLWSSVGDGGLGLGDYILALAPTPDGGVVATGLTDPYVNENILTLSYGADGTERWWTVADSVAGGWDAGRAIAVDAAGRTFVTGTSYMPDLSDPNFITLAYDAAGGLLWARERDGGLGADDYANSLTLNSRGTLLVTGRSDNGANSDFLTIAYSPGGHELFEQRYDGGGNDAAYLAIAGPDGSVFIGGVSDGADRDFFVYQLFDDTGLFADGFVSGDTAAWSTVAP